jgi:two-component system nitrate/nitrite response regulator NarL
MKAAAGGIMSIRVAFFDDHPILLEGLVGIFKALEDFEVVGQGYSAAEVLGTAKSLLPDVLVLDLNMPGDVLETIAAVARELPDIRFVIFTASTNVDNAVCALEAGANGYVVKGSTAAELVAALKGVVSGETYITTGFASKVIAALRTAAVRKKTVEQIRFSVREEQVVRLLLNGSTNRKIAQTLQISEKTVKQYMSSLMQKLNVRNRLEVVLAAQHLSIVQSPKTLQ